MLSSHVPLSSFLKVMGSTSILVSSICVVVCRQGWEKEAASPGPSCTSSVVGLASSTPVSRLQHGVNLFLACQTGFVPWERLKSGFQCKAAVRG